MDIVVCSLKNHDDCKTISVRRSALVVILSLVAAAATINFFIGLSIGASVLTAFSYLAYSFVLSLILLFIAVPGLGIWAAIIFNDMASTMQGLLGIASNPWITAIDTITFVGGIIFQVILWIVVIMMLFKLISVGWASDKKMNDNDWDFADKTMKFLREKQRELRMET